jgi:electron transport complex protein RnfC
VVTIPTKYPSGGEKQLIEILTGKEVPHNGLPTDIGIVCQNIGTCEAVYQAIAKGKPLISRITTITGESIEQPQNVEVLIGTPIKHLLAFAGFKQETSLFQKLLGSLNQTTLSDSKPRVIMGGPMMGFTLSSDELPILKSSNCILAPSQKELPANDMASACIRCGLCTEACPADLLPQQLYWFSKSGELDKAEQHNIADCIECGACSYVCPSQIPLVQYYRHAKGEIKEERAAHQKSERSRVRFEARQDRLDREVVEKEVKRQARTVAAEKAQAAKKVAAAQALADAAEKDDTAESASAPNAAVTTKPLAPLKKEISRDDIEKKLRAQQDRIDKTQQRFQLAQEQGSETLPVLQKGLDKQMQKLKGLEADLAQFDKAGI